MIIVVDALLYYRKFVNCRDCLAARLSVPHEARSTLFNAVFHPSFPMQMAQTPVAGFNPPLGPINPSNPLVFFDIAL